MKNSELPKPYSILQDNSEDEPIHVNVIEWLHYCTNEIGKSRTEYWTVSNQLREPDMSQTRRLAGAVWYIKREYVIVDTFVAISARIRHQWVNFNNIWKNMKISHLHVPIYLCVINIWVEKLLLTFGAIDPI